MTADEFFALGLSLPRVVEGVHDGHRDLRVRGKVIATVTADSAIAALRLKRRFQDNIIVIVDAAYPSPNPWGRAGWTQLALANASEEEARGMLELAWMTVMPGKLYHLLDDDELSPERA